MALTILCNGCKQELNTPGGVLFGIPGEGQLVPKYHLCVNCFRAVETVVLGLSGQGE